LELFGYKVVLFRVALMKNGNEKYCHECGEIIRSKAEICPKCGVRQPLHESMYAGIPSTGHSMFGQGRPRKKLTATLLALFLGGVGMHKFYLGRPIQGFLYLVFIWTFVPAIFGFIEALNFFTMSDLTFQKKFSGPAFSADD
jgi:TM2 domain-containing membrane protein YozV